MVHAKGNTILKILQSSKSWFRQWEAHQGNPLILRIMVWIMVKVFLFY